MNLDTDWSLAHVRGEYQNGDSEFDGMLSAEQTLKWLTMSTTHFWFANIPEADLCSVILFFSWLAHFKLGELGGGGVFPLGVLILFSISLF